MKLKKKVTKVTYVVLRDDGIYTENYVYSFSGKLKDVEIPPDAIVRKKERVLVEIDIPENIISSYATVSEVANKENN